MSGEPVFLVDTMPEAGRFVLDGDEGRHAATVLRLRRGERLILTDGQGRRADATVMEPGRGTLVLDVEEPSAEPAPALRVLLVQALPKGERSDLAVDLATESGVDEIVPWQSERCVARWTGSADKARRGREKWAATARAAAKQSRRTRLPVVHPLSTTDEIAARIRDADAALVLHEDGSVPLPTVELPDSGILVVVVGPEGGLSPREVAAFEAAGAVTVRLGREVLRTSTAAAVALGALGALTSRWE